MMHKAWCCLGEVPYCFSTLSVKFPGHTAKKIVDFDPNWGFLDCNSSLNSPMALIWCTKLEAAYSRCPIVFQGHPSNFNVIWDRKSPIVTQIGHFQTVTPVWIDCWLWNYAQSLRQHRRGALVFFKVICQISRSHRTKKLPILTWIECFQTVAPVWIDWWLWNDTQSLNYYRRGALLFVKVICQIWRSHGTKKLLIFYPNRAFPGSNSSLNWLMAMKWCRKLEEVPYCFSRSSVKFQGHMGQKITDYNPNWACLDCNFSFNSLMAMKWCTKLDIV